jgi:hypothetical protein
MTKDQNAVLNGDGQFSGASIPSPENAPVEQAPSPYRVDRRPDRRARKNSSQQQTPAENMKEITDTNKSDAKNNNGATQDAQRDPRPARPKPKPIDVQRAEELVIRGAVELLPPSPPNFRTIALERLRKRDFFGYLILFSSVVRLWGFLAIEPLLRDDEYWGLLRQVWITTQMIHQNKRIWTRLLTSNRPNRHLLMTDAERERLSAMPEVLKVYRGYSHVRGKNGWSWTLDPQKAKFLAKRACAREAFVCSGLCHKADVIAYFGEGTESEIIIPSSKVFSKTTASLPPLL